MYVCPECGATQPIAAPCIADGTPLVDAGDDQLLGTQIGAYRIARLLGIGGMGRVYKGVHPQIGSRVAIKVLSRECADRPDLVERFFYEAKSVNLIRHESIVNVLDLSKLPDGRPYIVMEYLDGSPLSSIIEQAPHRGPLPLGGVARLAAEVLDALGAAHAKGIVHRDLKPDNIYVTPAGRAKVLDFGIAKLKPELRGSATHTGSLLGTPHYMSSEQAAGKPVDARADLYSLGVILFECATLRKPFTADSLFELLRQHVDMPPPSPRALRPDMPPDLEHVILTALAKHPEQRFATAQAMSAALHHATSRLPPEAWAALTPTQASSASNWAPTPPASWAQRATQPQHPSTQTAGQVSSAARPAKGRGLWLAIGGIVVAGGITAAVVATNAGGTSAGAGSGSAGSNVVVASGDQTTVVVVERKDDDEAAAGGSDDETDLDPAIDQVLEQLPPESRAALPPGVQAALKKYGSWSKVPKSVRKKLAPELAMFDGSLGVGAMDQINSALAGGSEHALKMPNLDAKHVNLDAVTTWALAEARKLHPDAELTWIGIDSVYPDGHADLTLKAFAGDHGTIDVRFTTLAGAKRDPKVPRGVPQELKCNFRISIEPDGADITPMPADGCKQAAIPKPRCTLKQVWQKALARKSDLRDAVAQIYYTTNIVTHKIVWMFNIQDAGENLFSDQFPDDC
jgi:serine/threonine protein kinase